MIGDVLLATSMAQNVKEKFTEIEVHLFCYKSSIDVVTNNPYIDKIVCTTEKEYKTTLGFVKLLMQIKSENYDCILDPYNKLQSYLLSLFSGAKKRVSYGKGFFKHLFYTDLINQNSLIPFSSCDALSHKFMLVNKAFPEITKFKSEYKIFLEDKDISSGKRLLEEIGFDYNKPIIAWGILGSGHWKSYPLEYTKILINHVVEKWDCQILFNYSPSQTKEAKELYNGIVKKENIAHQLIGKNLKDFLNALANTHLSIACEGGMVHMAKALGIPNLNIYSPFISRESWGCMEDGYRYDSVHLRDYKPELFEGKIKKEIEANSLWFYNEFKPEYIVPQLDIYIERHISKSK